METMEAKAFKQSLTSFVLLLSALLSNTATADDDSAAMTMLAATIKPTPPNWSANSSDYCQWQGVQCKSNRVSIINLNSMSLTSIPDEFPSLPQLTFLTLSNNSISGSFPSLAKIPSLQILYLDKNNFDSIPPNFFKGLATTLRVLVFSSNPSLASWTIPTELTRLVRIGAFFCDRANLTGQLPDFFRSLPVENLSLSANKLFGPLPPSLGKSQIKNIWVHDNNLTGPIPGSLTRLPHLQLLDVSNNNLSGHIPHFEPSVKLSVNGNPLLFTGTTGNKKRVKKVIVIIAAILGAIIGVICVFLLGKRIAANHKASKEGSEVLNEELSRHNVLGRYKSRVRLQELQVLKFQELATATNNFHPTNKLGQGGFGPVYKGKFPDGQEIAVKRLSRASEQGLEEFINELEVISKLKHRNLVRLLGCCTESQEKMLVYEYMPNKSLDVFLFDPERRRLLDWRKRFNIINGIGRGLQYLHWDSGLRVIHRDLKASNILLDEDLDPKISDFGMARIFRDNEDGAKTKRVVGTYGYMSPEYAIKGQFSEKSDVFSFGILLLEIISGRKNTSFFNDQHAFSISGHAWKLWNEDNILALVDPWILDPSFHSEILRCTHVGLLCVQNFMGDRPNTSTIVSMLSGDIENLPPPEQAAFTDGKNTTEEQCSVNYVTLTMVEER